jgi:hypothetical protein
MEFYRHPSRIRETIDRVHAKSPMMRNRALTWNQNVSYLRNQLSGKAHKLRDTFFIPMTWMQGAIDMPTWLGAYDAALADGASEEGAIERADQAVLNSQGGGQIGDLAAVQRGKGLAQLFTRFYNYANTTFQMMARVVNREKHSGADYARAVHDMVLLSIVPSVLLSVIRAVAQGEDDDDDESFVEKMGREVLAANLGLVVFGREFASMTLGYSYQGPAGTKVIPAWGRVFGEIGELEFDMDLLKALNMAAGLSLGYPALQLQRTSEGILALAFGETDRISAPVFGPPR